MHEIEQIKGLIGHEFTFFNGGMLSEPKLGTNACQGVLRHVNECSYMMMSAKTCQVPRRVIVC